MVKSVLPCLVIVRRQPVPSLFHPSALHAPSLFAKTANSPYFVFNHFRTLLHSCTPRVLLISFLFFRLRTLCEKQGGVGVLFPNWNPTPSPSPRPAPLPSLSPSIRGGRRPRKSPRGGGCCRWKPFSSHRSFCLHRGCDTTATCARCAGGPWRLRRRSERLLRGRRRCAGRECRGRGGREQHGIFLACGIRCAGERIVWHTARRRSCRFPSAAPLPLAPTACYRSAAPASASFHGWSAPAASAHAPRLRTAPLRSQAAAASQTCRKHRRESVEWLVARTELSVRQELVVAHFKVNFFSETVVNQIVCVGVFGSHREENEFRYAIVIVVTGVQEFSEATNPTHRVIWSHEEPLVHERVYRIIRIAAPSAVTSVKVSGN